MLKDITGIPVGGKAVNISQLEAEMRAASVEVNQGLGMTDAVIFCYSGGGGTEPGSAAAQASDFPDPSAAQAVLNAHVAMRNKTDAEYSAEFQDAATTPARKQEIRDIMNGLLPREQVPM